MKWQYLVALGLAACSHKKTEAPAVGSGALVAADPKAPVAAPEPRAPVPDGPIVTTVLTAGGGSATSSDGLLAVTVPGGVLDQLTLQQIATDNPSSARGRGYRLEPSGKPFANPVQLVFSPEPGGTLDGAAATYLDAHKVWLAPPQTHDATGAIHVATSHFSDWSISSAIRLWPDQSSLGLSGSRALYVQICFVPAPTGTDEPTPIVCHDPKTAGKLLRGATLSVNGIEHGDASVGKVQLVDDTTISYVAPAHVPAHNPVAISVALATLPNERFGRLVGIANVLISDHKSYVGTFSSRSKHAEGETRTHGYAIWNYDAADARWHATGMLYVDAALGCGIARGGSHRIDPATTTLEITPGADKVVHYTARIPGVEIEMVPCQDTAVEGPIAGTGGLTTDPAQTGTLDKLADTFTDTDPDFPTTWTWDFREI